VFKFFWGDQALIQDASLKQSSCSMSMAFFLTRLLGIAELGKTQIQNKRFFLETFDGSIIEKRDNPEI